MRYVSSNVSSICFDVVGCSKIGDLDWRESSFLSTVDD
jgi:hypothetical protein